MLRFSLSISSTSGVRGRGGYWNYKMKWQTSFFPKQTPLQNGKPYGRHVVARWLTCCCLPWHYKMTTLQVLETSTSTKWQPGVVFQLPTLPVQSHSSTTPTQKQHVPPYPPNKNSPKVCCGERMCIMSPSLTSLKLLYHTWSALLQSFSIFFICSRSCNKHSLHASIFFIHL